MKTMEQYHYFLDLTLVEEKSASLLKLVAYKAYQQNQRYSHCWRCPCGKDKRWGDYGEELHGPNLDLTFHKLYCVIKSPEEITNLLLINDLEW